MAKAQHFTFRASAARTFHASKMKHFFIGDILELVTSSGKGTKLINDASNVCQCKVHYVWD